MMKLISVIIPVYNAVPYLEACVLSLRALSLPLEIILVDDGSTDGSSELCDRLGDKVIHQPNHGVSAARNTGMALASGEWIWFVDADDTIVDGTIRLEAYETVSPTKRQKAANDTLRNDDNALHVLSFIWEENGVTNQFEAHDGEIPYNLWRCWFRSKLLKKHDIRFTEGRRYAEDQEFIFRYLLSVKDAKIVASPQIIYHYTVRQGSAITRKGIKGKQVGDILKVTAVMWSCALKNCHIPHWIWFQTKRMLKTAWVTLTR